MWFAFGRCLGFVASWTWCLWAVVIVIFAFLLRMRTVWGVGFRLLCGIFVFKALTVEFGFV